MYKRVKFSCTICIFFVFLLISQSVITVSAASPVSSIGGSNSVNGVSALEAVMASEFVYAPLDHFKGKKLKEVFDVADRISNPKNSKKEKNRLIEKYKKMYKLDKRDIRLLKKKIYESRKYIRKQGLNENLLSSWKIIDSKDDNRYSDTKTETGFFGSALEKGNLIVISFRGTEFKDDAGDVGADIALSGGKTPAQYAVAKKFVERVVANKLISKKRKIILTGHSLGGWLVQKATIDMVKKSTKLNGHPFGGSFTFNAPGFWSGMLDKNIKSKNSNDYYNKYITNYIINSDTVGGTFFSDHVGKRIVLPFNSSQLNKPIALDEHGISNFYLLDYSKSGQMIFGTKFKNAHKQELTGIGDAFSGGRDWLDGGPGNTIDTLMGFAANDTYIFGKGYGKDNIYETDLIGENLWRGNGDSDVIMIKDFPATETVISRNQDDLKISFIRNASDSIVIHRFFKLRMYEVEMAKFSNGSTIFLDLPFPIAPKVNSVADTSTFVQGTAIPNSTVSIKLRGVEIGVGNTDSKGAFKVKIPKQKGGTTLSVTVINKARFESKVSTAIVKDTTPPSSPRVNTVTDQSTAVTGKAEVNSLISIKANGEEIGAGKTNSSGSFSIKIPKLLAGSKLSITSKDTALNESKPAIITVQDITAPSIPTAEQVTDESIVVNGHAEINSSISIKVNEKEIGAGKTNASGSFSITIPKQQAGTKLSITATDGAGHESEPIIITVEHITPPESERLIGTWKIENSISFRIDQMQEKRVNGLLTGYEFEGTGFNVYDRVVLFPVKGEMEGDNVTLYINFTDPSYFKAIYEEKYPTVLAKNPNIVDTIIKQIPYFKVTFNFKDFNQDDQSYYIEEKGFGWELQTGTVYNEGWTGHYYMRKKLP
ncbi:Ig-like domain-containing protein [Neobacillus drentensis]|uniref:Ig-like domain-containing protein n=1 Tax=Neobacillus drentensis TaxID=220684 RepID=UPI002FFD6F4D